MHGSSVITLTSTVLCSCAIELRVAEVAWTTLAISGRSSALSSSDFWIVCVSDENKKKTQFKAFENIVPRFTFLRSLYVNAAINTQVNDRSWMSSVQLYQFNHLVVLRHVLNEAKKGITEEPWDRATSQVCRVVLVSVYRPKEKKRASTH